MSLNDSLTSYFSDTSRRVFASVNMAVSFVSIFMNIFFVSSILFPQKGLERLKQPLKVLLESLVGNNVIAHICILMMVFNNLYQSYVVWYCAPLVAIYTMMSSVTSSHWLNIFYCCQLISVKHPFFIWLKRNIKIFIFSALLINTILYLFGLSVTFAITSIFNNYGNTTWETIDWTGLDRTVQGALWLALSFLFFSLSLMLVSSCMTVAFLWRHLRNMQDSSSSFTSPRRQTQIHATIKGITIQTVLHVICSVAVIINEVIFKYFTWYSDPYNCILSTVMSLYFFGTTINMGFIQSVFRERVAHVWQFFSSLAAYLNQECVMPFHLEFCQM